MPKVSIIMTSYNHEKHISKAIESVLAQTFTDFELIIVDDCSTDGSKDVIRSYAEQDLRIVPVFHETNKRRIFQHNLHRCTGEYIAIHHSDDEWSSDKLAKQVAYLDANPEVAACFTWVQFIDESGGEINPSLGFYVDTLFAQPNRSRHEWLRTFFFNGNKLCHPSVMIRKEMYLECGLFSAGLGAIPDFLMWIRLVRQREIHVMPERLTRFRLRDKQQNTSGDNYSNVVRASVEDYFVNKEYLHMPKEDFFKVFPEAKSYVMADGFMIEYAFAQICLKHTWRSRALFALELLYGLLNNPESAAKLEKIYGFGNMELIKLTDKYDAFGIMADKRMLRSALDLDFGEGFGCGDSILKTEYFPQTNQFSVSYSLEKSEGVRALRFRVQQGEYICCRITSVLIDGIERAGKALYAKGMDGGFDVFPTTHAAYLLDVVGEKITITGEIKVASGWNYLTMLQTTPEHLKVSRKKILYGAGFYGEQALYYFGADLVHAFVDQNKAGAECFGKKVIHPSELLHMSDEYEIIICVKAYREVIDYLKNAGVCHFGVFDVIKDFESR